jgi:hypothetical protein
MYCVVCAFVTVAIVAIVFAVLAWQDSQARKPHRCLERSNIVARGHLFADGDIRTKGGLRVDGETQLRCKARLARAAVQSLAFDNLLRITTLGPVMMDKAHTAYRVDTAGAQTIVLQLPPIAEAPSQIFQVMVSRLGAANTVHINVAPGDALSTGGTAITLNPAYTLPATSGQPDHVLLFNDGLSTWFAIAHA